ncbi:hypothetical protein N7492_006478 [Penicillium capsulatum]|uniref:Transcriptional regulator n=1 Tax=Penicillium capsulatum TaxID=69766 RepID=A0A9W9LL67_9EURO|nr:hypothetical protein N7492_006478 [Penicillium capsulatum]KAJ6116319.1 hypothetical protein N7512_006044 [Penicillium capsulatum]
MAPKYTLSDSESEAEASVPANPSDKALERGLRDEVAGIYKSGKMDELTVKRVRLAVEKALGLTEGFFKTTGDWKTRSDQIIKDEVEIQENTAQNVADDEPEEKSASPSPRPKKTAAPKRGKGEKVSKPRKRQKTETPVSEDEAQASSGGDDEGMDTTPNRAKASSNNEAGSKSPAETSPAAPDTEKETEPTKTSPKAAGGDSESEMSVVFDEEPEPAKNQRKSAEKPAKKEKKPAPKAKGKDEDLDPDQAEIKRLQGWLVKCGIRKMWWRELAPYETPKAKIKHLKQMLDDAGMKGRYSVEKARQIREERELKADLEQIQQGAKQWGTGSGEEGDEAPPPRRAARGRQALAFLESEGEESD